MPATNMKEMRARLQDAIVFSRESVAAVKDPQGRALLETAAEVLAGLNTAFEHYEKKSEEAWK